MSEENNSIKSSEIKSNNNDKIFNRLKELQALIKKESSLKELCKKDLKIKIHLYILQLFTQGKKQKDKQNFNAKLYIKANQRL